MKKQQRDGKPKKKPKEAVEVKIIITEMKITRGFQKHICAGRKKNQQS
jgi:hypothetical protein